MQNYKTCVYARTHVHIYMKDMGDMGMDILRIFSF